MLKNQEGESIVSAILMTCPCPSPFGGYPMSLTDWIISGLTLLAVGVAIVFLVAYWDSIKKMVRSWIK
jgi:phosphate/sulfate permease